MKTVSLEEFIAGETTIGGVPTPLVDGEQVQVSMAGALEKRYYYTPEDVPNTDLVITSNDFRDRFGMVYKAKLDRLEDNLDNPTVALEVCVNLTAATYPFYQDHLRVLYKDLYTSDTIHLDNPEVIDGVNLLVTVGAITQAIADTVLSLDP